MRYGILKQQCVLGISQRDINYYGFLADMKDDLETTIHEFFEDRIRDQFEGDNCRYSFPKELFLLVIKPLTLSLMLDVFDVYILQNRRTVKLVDFNPFSQTTDGLLYEWSELYQSKLYCLCTSW
jgi:hypothetical protein